MKKKTLIELLLRCLEKFDNNNGIINTKVGEDYVPVSRYELLSEVKKLKKYFDSLKLKANDKVAIISENRTEWIITDFACMLSNLISVPLFTSLSAEATKYILKDSSCIICFVSNELQLHKVLSVKNELPELKYIVCFNQVKTNGNVLSFQKLLNSFKETDGKDIKNIIEDLSKDISEEDIVTIIYTSGTTGIPKGVMLTHKNICSNILACMKVLALTENDSFLSFLPFSHSYERTAGYYLAFFSGSKIYFAKSIDTIAMQMQEVKPTMMITVPRLLDKMYNRVMRRSDDMPDGFGKKLFVWAIKLAKNHKRKKYSIKWFIADKLVYKKIIARTGGRVKFFVSGGGALNKSVGEFFDRIGITTLEGYGLTETSPVISVNRPGKNKYGTVGIPLDGVEVKVAADSEIIIRGDLVMKGYYKSEEETRKTIKDGWLYTGDIGKIDKENYIMITDRKKSLLKSSGGKYIPPTHIEDIVQQLTYIDQVLIIGNERMYVTALIVPDIEELRNLSKKMNLNIQSNSDLVRNKELLKKIDTDINNIQKDLSQYEKIRKFTLLEKPFTIESGELTPTMKIKRKIVEEKYKDIIEKMYHKV